MFSFRFADVSVSLVLGTECVHKLTLKLVQLVMRKRRRSIMSICLKMKIIGKSGERKDLRPVPVRLIIYRM